MAASKNHLEIICQPGDSHSDTVLYELAQTAEHVIILNDHEEDLEKSDMRVIFLLMRLRDIRERYNLRFNITAEMQKEYNQKLVGRGDHTDFLVASSMSSLVLAQLAESPELKEVFREILSNEGNELYLKDASKAGLQGKYTVRDLRRIILQQGYVFLGHLDAEKNSRFNLPLDEELELTDKDNLIVLGQK